MAVLDPNEIMFTAFEPKVQNRFIMYIDGIPSYIIKKISRPSVEMNEIKIDHINVYRKIKGKANWADITCDLYDPITPSGAQAVMEWVRLAHESVTGRDGYSDFYKKDIRINVLGPVGDVVEEWILKGAFVKTANFGDMDWTAGEALANINLTIGMDYCILNY
tara:strand:- start:21 stop:509 length:489 start_codon:yes stop_codon:yes gene_type:complete